MNFVKKRNDNIIVTDQYFIKYVGQLEKTVRKMSGELIADDYNFIK